jgi:hypothetical protein
MIQEPTLRIVVYALMLSECATSAFPPTRVHEEWEGVPSTFEVIQATKDHKCFWRV